MNGCSRIRRHRKIVAERRAERRFIARFHGHSVNERRPEIAFTDGKHIAKRLGFGKHTLELFFCRVHRLACLSFAGARGLQCLFRFFGSFRCFQNFADGGFNLFGLLGDGDLLGLCIGQRLAFIRNGLKLLDKLFDARGALFDRAFQALALGAERGSFIRQRVELALARSQGFFGACNAGARFFLGGALRFVFAGKGSFFLGELGDSFVRVGDKAAFTLKVGGNLRQPRGQPLGLFAGALFFRIEIFPLHRQPVQFGGGNGFCLAQRRDFFGRLGLRSGGDGGSFGIFGNPRVGIGKAFFFGFQKLLGVAPAQVEEHGFCLPDKA